MTWELLAGVVVVSTAVAYLFERILMRDETSNPITYAIIFQFLLGLVTFVFALLFGKFVLPHDFGMWYRYIFSAVLWASATVASLKAMKLLLAGEATILGTTSSIVSITLGIILFKERLTTFSMIGIGLIFLAIWLVFSGNLSFKSKSGIVFALLSAFLGGLAVINDIIILRTYEAFSYTTIMSILPGFVLLLVFPKNLFKYRNLLSVKSLRTMILLAFFYSIQSIAYYSAIEQHAPVSKLSPLSRTSIILTVILAAVFLKERTQIVKKVIAAVMVTIGAILIG